MSLSSASMSSGLVGDKLREVPLGRSMVGGREGVQADGKVVS